MSATLKRFQVNFRGRNIFTGFPMLPKSGARYGPVLEWALTARWWGYTWEAFSELDGGAQSFLVAVYRVAHQLEAIEAWWARRKSR